MATGPITKSRRARRRRPTSATGRVRAADLLRSIAVGVSANSGESYLRLLVQRLSETFGMDYAFVGKLSHHLDEVVSVLGACFIGRMVDDFGFHPLTTPCHNVVKGELCIYPRGVQKLFPEDHSLAKLQVECFAGIPLYGSSGQLLGLLAVMDRKPLRHRETVELSLQLLAPRAAAEIERMQVYEELGESHRALSTLLGNLPGMAYRCRNDKDWTLEFASDGCLDLTGYPPEDFVSRRTISYAQLIHPEDQEPVWNDVQAALNQNRPFHLVYRITTAKGEMKWVWEQGRGVFSTEGELLALEGFIADITERKRAEEALRESEARLNSVVTTALNIIIVLDPDHRILEFNPEAERVYGRRREEVLGQDYFELFLPREAWKVVDDDLKSVLSGKETRGFENSIRAANGGKRTIRWNVSRMDDVTGQPIGVVAIGADVTERRQAEEALRESEMQLNEAQRIAHIGSWELDLVADHLIWSEEIFRIFEIDPRRFRASYEAFLDAVHPDDRAAINRAYTESVKNRTPYAITHRLQMPDGRIKYVHEHGMNYYSEQGKPLRSVGTVQDITERMLAEQALRQSEERLRVIYDASPVVISVSRLEDGRYLEVNPAFLRTGGWVREEVIGRTSFELGVWVNPEDREKIVEGVHAHGAVRDLEIAFRMKSGEVRLLLCSVELIQLELGDCLLLIGQDITERKKAQTQMQKLSRALEQTADAVLITDRNGTIEYVNPAFEQVTGYVSAEATGRQPNLLKSGRQGPGFYENLWKIILAGEVFNDVLINRRKDGSLYYEEKTITPLKDADGRITHFIATGKDITERMQTQERLAFMAQHDPLTELPNRALLLDRLKQSLAGARWRERRAAVLFVDLDRFKTINDTLGHEVGDRLLQQLAERFQRSVREGDTVARFGGDEFVILLDDVATEDDVSGVAKKVLQALAPPFQVDHQTLYVTASIGVSLFPNDGDDATALLKNADIAMYRAKELGKNTYQFYSADMSSRAFERLALESNLRHALEHGELRLYYQPQIDVTTGAIVGVEALLRWQHPEFGLVMPNDFIPLLEETGLIVPVGEWVLDTACAQLAAWHAQGWPRLRLAVNLSPRQFQTQNLTAVVKQALDRLDGDPGRLELEITEGMLVRHAPATVETLEELHALGVRMAIDDFGTGYSSLSYLRRLPIDTIKIDRSFVRDIPQDADDSAITVAIIALAQSLKLEMIAEGVENDAQREFLRARGCSVMQGFLFCRPQPPEDITRLLRAQTPP